MPLGPPSQAWQSGGQEAGIPSLPLPFFISPWKVVPWVSDQRVASQLLWEPKLNLKVKAGVASELGKETPSFPCSSSYQFHFLLPPLSLPASLQAFLLQTVDGKHQDLKYISPETVSVDEPFAC